MLTIFVIDDATANVHRKRDSQTWGGIAPLTEMMVMGRALKMGCIYLAHDHSSVSETISQNTEILTIMGMPGESNYKLRNYLDFTDDQISVVKTLNPGQAVMINRSLWHKPVLINIQDPQKPESCPDVLVRQSIEGFLRQVKTTPPYKIPEAAKTAAPTPNLTPTSATPNLEQKHVDFLVLAAKMPTQSLSTLYGKLNLANSEGRRIVKKMESLGLLVFHALATGRCGGKVKLPEVTDIGWTILLQKGHTKPKSKNQGSWLHKATGCLIEAEGKSLQEKVTFEVYIDGCRIDVLRIDVKTKQRIFYNIGLSTPEYEAQSIIKFFSLPAAHSAQFVLVVETKSFATKVERCLKKSPDGRSVLTRYATRLIGSFVKT